MSTANTDDKLIGATAVAQYLGIGRAAVLALRDQGAPIHRDGKAHWDLTASRRALARWIASER